MKLVIVFPSLSSGPTPSCAEERWWRVATSTGAPGEPGAGYGPDVNSGANSTSRFRLTYIIHA